MLVYDNIGQNECSKKFFYEYMGEIDFAYILFADQYERRVVVTKNKCHLTYACESLATDQAYVR